MTKQLIDGLLIITHVDGRILKQSVHPETQRPWASEEEAFAYPFDNRFPWRTAEEWDAIENPAVVKHISPAVFQLLFTFQEMAFIEGMIETDAAIRRLDKLLTQDLDYVDMDLPIVSDGVRYMLDKMVSDADFPLTQEESDLRYAAIMAVQIPGK